jgi:hypothetical protein
MQKDCTIRPSFDTYVRLIAAGTPKEKAKVLAGYSPRSSVSSLEASHPQQMASIPELRRRFQAIPGFTIMDQMLFYQDVRDTKDADINARISSAKQLDKVMGYEAPRETDVTYTADLSQALSVLQALAGVNPADMIQELEAQEVEFEDIEDSEDSDLL